MKILLAKPIIEKSKRVHTVHPLSIAYLAAGLRKYNDVSILDCEKLGYGANDFANHITREKPELIGITVFSHNIDLVQKSVCIIRNHVPNTVIVLGGPHVNAKGPKVFREFPSIDYAIRGEAEKSILILAHIIKNRNFKSCSKVPGLIYRDDDEIVKEVKNIFIDDISQFDPMPYDLLDIQSYFGGVPQGFFCQNKEHVSIITSRGCPYPCTFCACSVNNGKKVRYRKMKNVIEEIELLVTKYGVKEIHILDDNFTFSKEYALKLSEEIIQRRFHIDLALPNGIRLDKIDDELLSIMRQAGFYSISFGIESGSDETLQRIKKLEKTAFIRKQILLAKKHGFRVTGTFIIGFPWEKRKDVELTLQFAKSLPLDHAAFGNFTPLPATEITEDLIRSGELLEEYEVPYTWGEITYSPPGMKNDELKELQRKCVFNFYFPRRIHLIIGNIRWSNIMQFMRRLLLLFRNK